MILMNKLSIDFLSFNESHFGIFGDNDKEALLKIFIENAERNPLKFLTFLSPDQKGILSNWACDRITYSRKELIHSLEKFLKFLKSSKSELYPKKPKK